MNINEITTKLADDKYKNVSARLGDLIDLQEYSEQADIIRDSLEYIDLLERSVHEFDTIKKNSAKAIKEEINPLILEYKNLESKSEWLWKKNALGKYEAVLQQMSVIEKLLQYKYNYNILKPDGSVNK